MTFPSAGGWKRDFDTSDGRKGLLRPLSWNDLDDCLAFATDLVREYEADVHHGTLLAKVPTRVEEMKWLGRTLTGIEEGTTISVCSLVEGRFAGNSEVSRDAHPDLLYFGTLGIAVSRPYRGVGVGTAMMSALIEESRRAGLKTLELKALASNARAIHLYEKVGFKRVGVVPGKIRRRGTVIGEMIMSMEL